jgi:hypothetical protein
MNRDDMSLPALEIDRAHQPSRRRVLVQSAALVALACAGAPLPASASVGDQNEWRFCSKCSAMFWNGAGPKGVCAGGGAHVAQGLLFLLHYDDAQANKNIMQYAWRYCAKCRSLFFDGAPTKGRCPAGAGHTASGFMFGLNFQSPAPARTQTDWRFCDKCFALFWNGGTAKGKCPAGGGHNAQGFTFNLASEAASADPGAVVSDALQNIVVAERIPIQDYLKGQLGRGDLVRKGFTLYDINLQLGQPDFQSTGTSFSYKLTGNYLYLKSTTPTVMGSYGDPAFEIHFDVALVGTIVRAGDKVRVEGVVASVPTITVKPRNVSGDVVTTFVHFFSMTEYGGRIIQQTVDKYLRQDLTDKINAELQQV